MLYLKFFFDVCLKNNFLGICVVTTHLKNNRQFEIFGLTNESTRNILVDDKMLSSYFYEKHRIKLTRLDLPCVIEKQPRKESGLHVSNHPMELLKIIDGQRVSNSKCDNIVIFLSCRLIFK